MFKTIVIGAGSFGEKRARAVKESSLGILLGVADVNTGRANEVGEKLGVRSYSIDEVFETDADVVTISSPNKYHMPLSIKALESGKHVLCEKPLSLNAKEAQDIVKAGKKTGKFVKMGSNHRYFPTVMRAYEIFKSGEIGDIVSLNGRIGHNGERIKESWFWDKEISGGGTLLDNGCHLVDIARWFMGDFSEAMGVTSNIYWKDCPVEDTASGIFITSDRKMALISSSWRQLAGYIHVEINGTHGYITVDGRFDTHGGDKIYWKGENNGLIKCEDFGHVPPQSYVWELNGFYDALRDNKQPEPSAEDGVKVMKMIDAIYESNNQKVYL